jgi:hypothetical protein
VVQLLEENYKFFHVSIMINEQKKQELLIHDKQQILLHQLIPLKQKNNIKIKFFFLSI